MPLGAARLTLLAFQPTVAVEAEVIRKKQGIQANGNAQVDTAQSYFGGSSALFDGTGDYLDCNQPIIPSDSDFTIECWARTPSIPISDNYFLITQYSASGEGRNGLSFNQSLGKFRYVANGSNQVLLDSTTSYAANTWYHLAVVRNGDDYTLYVDGTSEATDNSSMSLDQTANCIVGSRNGVASYHNGHIDEVRISNSARYTSGFTPSTTPFVNDDDTLLLMHMDGTDGSTYFDDDNGVGRSAVGVSAIGNAQVDTAQYKFGGASALFDGTGDYLQSPLASTINFGTGDFTVECWIRFASLTNGEVFISGSGTGSVFIQHITNAFRIGRAGVAFDSTTSTVTTNTNTWYHFAVSRSSGNMKIFVDGVAYFDNTNTNNYSFSTNILIGGTSTSSQQLNGYLDEVRISDTARYTSNFTAPTAPFVNDSNTLMLAHMDGTDGSTLFLDDNGASVPASRGIADSQITAVNEAQIDTAIYKWGTSSLLLDGTNDRLEVTGNYSQTGDFTAECWIYPTSTSGTRLAFAIGNESSDRQSVYFTGSNLQTDEYGSGGVDILASGGGITINNWHHIALVREGSTVSLYQNGSRLGTTTSTATIGNANNLYIGTLSDGAIDFVGNIDEFRLSRTARYSGASYTTPTEAFTDDSDTLLLLHMEGADGSTRFIDGEDKRSRVGIKAIGNGHTETSQSKFGGTSYEATNQGNYLDLDNFGALGNGDWTLEAFVRFKVLSGAQMVFDWRPPSTQGAYPTLYVSGNTLIFYQSSASRISSGGVLGTNTWYHFAVCKSGNSTKLFIDGTQVGSTYTDNNNYLGERLRLFGDGFNAGNATLDGFVDEVRISKSARYTANFTPTTESFQNDANTLLLLHMDGTDGGTDFVDDNGKESA